MKSTSLNTHIIYRLFIFFIFVYNLDLVAQEGRNIILTSISSERVSHPISECPITPGTVTGWVKFADGRDPQRISFQLDQVIGRGAEGTVYSLREGFSGFALKVDNVPFHSGQANQTWKFFYQLTQGNDERSVFFRHFRDYLVMPYAYVDIEVSGPSGKRTYPALLSPRLGGSLELLANQITRPMDRLRIAEQLINFAKKTEEFFEKYGFIFPDLKIQNIGYRQLPNGSIQLVFMDFASMIKIDAATNNIPFTPATIPPHFFSSIEKPSSAIPIKRFMWGMVLHNFITNTTSLRDLAPDYVEDFTDEDFITLFRLRERDKKVNNIMSEYRKFHTNELRDELISAVLPPEFKGSIFELRWHRVFDQVVTWMHPEETKRIHLGAGVKVQLINSKAQNCASLLNLFFSPSLRQAWK